MKKFILPIILIFSGACSSSLEYNEAIEKNNKKLATEELKSDARFLVEAKSYSLLLNQLGELAVQNGYASSIQGYGSQIILAQNNLGEQLEQLAKNEKISLPVTMSESHSRTLGELRNASRQEFDRQFIRSVERIYEDQVELFKSTATTANDDEVRAFAAKNLRNLQDSQQTADRIENDLLN